MPLLSLQGPSQTGHHQHSPTVYPPSCSRRHCAEAGGWGGLTCLGLIPWALIQPWKRVPVRLSFTHTQKLQAWSETLSTGVRYGAGPPLLPTKSSVLSSLLGPGVSWDKDLGSHCSGSPEQQVSHSFSFSQSSPRQRRTARIGVVVLPAMVSSVQTIYKIHWQQSKKWGVNMVSALSGRSWVPHQWPGRKGSSPSLKDGAKETASSGLSA